MRGVSLIGENSQGHREAALPLAIAARGFHEFALNRPETEFATWQQLSPT